MMPKNSVQSGRFMLLVGVGLCGLVLLDAHQEMLAARLEATPQTRPSQPSTEAIVPSASTPQPSTSQPSSMAINTGVVDAGSEPVVTELTPDQLSFNEWHGASFPVEDFQSYTSPFGYRRSPTGGYSQEFHYGLDLAAPQGSYIRNWWTGVVVEVSDNSNCGTSVIVESGEWVHIYCHMQGHVESDDRGRYMIDRDGGIQVWEGQEVSAGQRIGRVGMTGRTTGPHLHWGLKYEENWVDPGLVLRAMYQGQQNAYQGAPEAVQ
jgi:murein DD-endopeptidase MepM/ murein hydrolase activator NlpD